MGVMRKFVLVLSVSCLLICCVSRRGGMAVHPSVPVGAEYFSPSEVRLCEGPLKELQKQGEDYLLWLDPDSLLHYFHVEAGLRPKADAYAGWESQDVWGVGPLRGGFMGYYLSGLSLM